MWRSFLISLFLLGCTAQKQLNLPFRMDGGVHFYAENKKVTALHLYDKVPFQSGDWDIHWEKSDKEGFEFCDHEHKLYDPLYLLMPNGHKFHGIIYYLDSEKRWLADFSIRIRPGYSGSPVFCDEHGKLVGLISGYTAEVAFGVHVYDFVIVGKFPPKLLKKE